MKEKQGLHIVALDIPYPPDYGGVMDIFYKIKALNAIGYEIILHCCQYGERKPQPTLNQYCREVHYYPRNRSIFSFLKKEPFIIETRKNKSLVQRLLQDNFPVLMEGLHHAWILDELPKERRTILRVHNIEADYYHNLFLQESSFSKKIFFWAEAKKLRIIEESYWKKAQRLCCISQTETQIISKINESAEWIPPFHGQTQTSLTGKGEYILFHGKLSVNENEKAVLKILELIGNSEQRFPIKIAGKNPSEKLRKTISTYRQVQLIPNPSAEEMSLLIHHAHLILVWAFQESGVKLKLLDSLFNGRFVVANAEAVCGSGLEDACLLTHEKDLQKAVLSIQNQEFTIFEKQKRMTLLSEYYDDSRNAERMAV